MSDGKRPPDDDQADYEVVEEDNAPAPSDEARPRKKRRKKKRRPRRSLEPAHRTEVSESGSWALPIGRLIAGVIMCLVASVGVAGKDHALRAIGGMLVYLIIIIPLIIGLLMVVGSFAGIDYGEFKRAILNLAAIAFFNNGIIW